MSHSNIALFVAHLGCPNMCSFCNQRFIAGTEVIPDENTAGTEGFYQIVDADNNVTESGFLEHQADNDELIYTLVLPAEIDINTMVRIQTYQDNTWCDVEMELYSSRADFETVVDLCTNYDMQNILEQLNSIHAAGQTLWIAEELMTGSKLRYIIK